MSVHSRRRRRRRAPCHQTLPVRAGLVQRRFILSSAAGSVSMQRRRSRPADMRLRRTDGKSVESATGREPGNGGCRGGRRRRRRVDEDKDASLMAGSPRASFTAHELN